MDAMKNKIEKEITTMIISKSNTLIIFIDYAVCEAPVYLSAKGVCAV